MQRGSRTRGALVCDPPGPGSVNAVLQPSFGSRRKHALKVSFSASSGAIGLSAIGRSSDRSVAR